MLGQVDFGLIVTGSERQLGLRLENVVLLLLFIHFLDINLHQLVRLNSLANGELTLAPWASTAVLRIENLVIEFDLVFESLSTTIE